MALRAAYLICAAWSSGTTLALLAWRVEPMGLVPGLDEAVPPLVIGMAGAPLCSWFAWSKVRKHQALNRATLLAGCVFLVCALCYFRVLLLNHRQVGRGGWAKFEHAVWVGTWFWYSVPASLCLVAMGWAGLAIGRRSVRQGVLTEPDEALSHLRQGDG